MGRKAVSQEKRIEIAALLKVCRSKAEVARRAVVSRCVVQNIAKKIANRESLGNRKGQGRHRVSTPAGDRQLKRLSYQQRTKSSRRLAPEWSSLIGRPVSARTVRRRLYSQGIKSYVAMRRPFRTRAQVKKRLNWCNKMLLWSISQWSQIVWSDESHFELINRKNRIYIRRRHCEENFDFNFQPRIQAGGGHVSVWGCMTANGPGPICFYEGRLNAPAYINIIKDHLPLCLITKFGRNHCDWYYQQDNAPCHRATRTINWLKKKKIKLLEWPPSSPDLNPIESLWSVVDRELEKLTITSTGQLKEAIEKTWKNLDVNLCKRLVESMPNRVAQVLKSRGKSCCKY